MVGDARVVGLGESTHGTRESCLLKHRLFRLLHERAGFSALVLETSLPDVARLNAWIQTGEGDPEDLLHAQGFWTVDTEEVLNLVR